MRGKRDPRRFRDAAEILTRVFPATRAKRDWERRRQDARGFTDAGGIRRRWPATVELA